MLPIFKQGFLIANVRKHFAEFLMDNSPITLECSSHPLVLVLVQLFFLFSFQAHRSKRQIRKYLIFGQKPDKNFTHRESFSLVSQGLYRKQYDHHIPVKPWAFGESFRKIFQLLIITLSLLIYTFYNYLKIQNDLLPLSKKTSLSFSQKISRLDLRFSSTLIK